MPGEGRIVEDGSAGSGADFFAYGDADSEGDGIFALPRVPAVGAGETVDALGADVIGQEAEAGFHAGEEFLEEGFWTRVGGESPAGEEQQSPVQPRVRHRRDCRPGERGWEEKTAGGGGYGGFLRRGAGALSRGGLWRGEAQRCEWGTRDGSGRTRSGVTGSGGAEAP
jgi:hypothetical protein